MNEALLETWEKFCFVLAVPFIIVLIKTILQIVLKAINLFLHCVSKYRQNRIAKKYRYTYCFPDFYSLNEDNPEYPDLKKDYEKWNKARFNGFLEPVLDFLENFSFGDLEKWACYCFVSVILFVVSFAVYVNVVGDYYNAKTFWDKGNYSKIENFKNFEKFPNWNSNGKEIIRSAEKINEKYFEVDGTVNKDEFYFILPDEQGRYIVKSTGKPLAPINTDKMWSTWTKRISSD